ncbi:GIY-YIG nuclease family protein [Pyxidicoccus sp. 3LG]
MYGRAIRIFLVDGTPTGIRTVEVGLSTIKAVIAPRTALGELFRRDEAEKTGVYLLVGDDPQLPGRLVLYIGEGDSVRSRIQNHDANKEFWHTVVLFVSKDTSLTKAHVRWLEARLITLGRDAKRAEVSNKNTPEGGQLPEADQAEMGEFIEQIRLVLGTLGYDVFSPQAHDAKKPASAENPTSEAEFFFSGDGFDARCAVIGDAFVIRAGSEARATESFALQPGYRTRRAALLQDGVLAKGKDALTFKQDFAFPSPSAAAAVVSGNSVNGRIAWKMADGTTYAEWEERQAAEQED